MTELSSSSLARRLPRQRGFSFIEAIVVVAIIGILATLGAPEIARITHQNKMISFSRTSATLVIKARLQAIRKGRSVCVDFQDRHVVVKLEDCDAADAEEIGKGDIPASVNYGGPPADSDEVVGFEALAAPDEARIIFLPDGSVEAIGAVRFVDQRQTRNYLELWVGPTRAAPLVRFRKWNDDHGAWYAKGEGPGTGGWTWF